jgi:hypothetical protein
VRGWEKENVILKATLQGRDKTGCGAAEGLCSALEEASRELAVTAIEGRFDRPQRTLGALRGEAVGLSEGELGPLRIADSVENSTRDPPDLDRVRVLTDRLCEDT